MPKELSSDVLLGSRTDVKVTICPPGPESPELRFQPFQFDEKLGKTAARSLTPEAIRLISRDPTLGTEIHTMVENAKRELEKEVPE